MAARVIDDMLLEDILTTILLEKQNQRLSTSSYRLSQS